MPDHKDLSGVAPADRDHVSARPEPPDQPGAAKLIADQVAEARKHEPKPEPTPPVETPQPAVKSAPNPAVRPAERPR